MSSSADGDPRDATAPTVFRASFMLPAVRALGLLVGAALVHAAPRKTLPRPADPFLDPQNDPYNPLRYIASNVLTAIAFWRIHLVVDAFRLYVLPLLIDGQLNAFQALVMVVALTQTWMVRKWGAKFMLSMVIGCYTFAFGIGTRFGLHTHPESKGIYIIEYLFVVLSPCAFIASEYVLLGRLARYLRCDSLLLVPPRRITIVFISSDITTFLIQAAGGSVSIASNTPSVAINGSHVYCCFKVFFCLIHAQIFLAGLVLQMASFLTFTSIFLVFMYRVRTREPAIWTMDKDKNWQKDWRTLAGAMSFSFLGILIRSGYRVAELSQGYIGHLATTESFFYGLDTLPLFIAISTYVVFWPGRFIGNGNSPEATADLKTPNAESVESKEEE
ncbi:RTA1-domain-containing protein [Mycena chlorophos]|uniref:RTA1-domain-containing protein n=1 Tax=Mycena chlorophos TaxID=658473 RepID=A0A8H6S6Q6_MYCCL|nr:RTA1-domain-containing protein [Mycena chlorophos]